jgi:hypothetical protein
MAVLTILILGLFRCGSMLLKKSMTDSERAIFYS